MHPLPIALLGYGRMGKEIEKTALARGHRIVAKIDREPDWENQTQGLKEAGVAIDFSTPAAAASNIARCFDIHLPVVVGTTGWLESLPALQERCLHARQALFHAADFSIGVHIFLSTARFLSQKMNPLPDYAARIEETHHIHKLDKPSGTAIRLAETAASQMTRYRGLRLSENPSQTACQEVIPVECRRIGEKLATHRLFF